MSLLDIVLDVRCVGCREWGASLCDRCTAHITVTPIHWVRDGIPFTALGEYRGALRALILSIKQGRHRAVLRRLAPAITYGARNFSDCIAIPVPSSNRGLQRRGFSLSAMVAMHTGLVVRRAVSLSDTSSQIGLSGAHRRRHRAMSFVGGREMAGRKVLIVDDVCATGTTIHDVITLCRHHGMTVCGVLVLAVSDFTATHGEALHNSRTRVYG